MRFLEDPQIVTFAIVLFSRCIVVNEMRVIINITELKSQPALQRKQWECHASFVLRNVTTTGSTHSQQPL